MPNCLHLGAIPWRKFVRFLTKQLGLRMDTTGCLGHYLGPFRSPCTSGHLKPPVRADRVIERFARSSYAPLGHGVGRSICGVEGLPIGKCPLRPWRGRRGRLPLESVFMTTSPLPPQRRRATHSPPWVGSGSPVATPTERHCSAQGPQGSVQFFLQRVQGGLYVEREEVPRRGIRVCQSLHFDERGKFERWREDDPIRFEQPLLYLQLQRDAEALWDIESTNCALPR